MSNFLLCGCGQRVGTADKRPGDVVVCPACGGEMPIPGDSTDEFVRQLLTGNTPGVFAHVQLDTPPPVPPQKPEGWLRRLRRRLGLG